MSYYSFDQYTRNQRRYGSSNGGNGGIITALICIAIFVGFMAIITANAPPDIKTAPSQTVTIRVIKFDRVRVGKYRIDHLIYGDDEKQYMLYTANLDWEGCKVQEANDTIQIGGQYTMTVYGEYDAENGDYPAICIATPKASSKK